MAFWPERIKSGVDLIDLTKQPPLEFSDVSKEKFPCFYLAKEMAIEGESFPTAMNAVNELAVATAGFNPRSEFIIAFSILLTISFYFLEFLFLLLTG